MLGVAYCLKCRSDISQYGEIPNLLFEQICEHYIFTREGMRIPCSPDSEYHIFSKAIDFLESKGYVVSTEEGKDEIKVKPLGFSCEEEAGACICSICFDRDGHE